MGASGSGLDSSWYVTRHSREIEEIVTQVDNAAAETGLYRGPLPAVRQLVDPFLDRGSPPPLGYLVVRL